MSGENEGGEVLRRAAALMRDRATRSIRSPWHVDRRVDGHAWVCESTGDGRWEPMIEMRGLPNTAEHVASWHPAVALAVAVMLDTAGADLWAYGPLHCAAGCVECDDVLWMPYVRGALAVARAYLGLDRESTSSS